MITNLKQVSPNGNNPPLNVIAVTSGKGGVGKTNIAVNLAVALGRLDRKVLLFDADLGLANVDIVLGLKPQYDISHVISGERTLDEILMEEPDGVRVLPASSGVAGLTQLSASQQAGLISAFSDMSYPADVLIVDTGAGIDTNVQTFASACQTVIVVVCDEPTSITDAYALIKVLNRDCGVKSFQLISNMVMNDVHGRKLFAKVSRVAEKFLDVHLGYMGAIPLDEFLRAAVRQRASVMKLYPRSASAVAFAQMAKKLSSEAVPDAGNRGLGFFFEKLVKYPRSTTEAI